MTPINQTGSDLPSLSDRQLERERIAIDLGLIRARLKAQRAAALGEVTRVEHIAIEQLLPTVAGFLKELVDATASSRQPPVWYPILSQLDCDEVAAGALRAAFGSALRPSTTRSRALRAQGTALDICWTMSGLKADAEGAKAKARVKALTKGRSSPRARALAIRRAGEEASIPMAGENNGLLQAYGAPLLSAVLATGLFDTPEAVTRNGHTEVSWVLSEAGLALAAAVDDLGLLAHPLMRPMLVQPRPWVDTTTGAYLSECD
jgi:DNA-directed RNA polymerase